MADIQYINYNDLLINSLDLLQNMANDVVNYVNNLPWTLKRKKRFLEVYKTFINNGIESGSVKTGLPTVHIGGETIDINSLPKLDREVYGAVADFVYNLMGRLTSLESEKPELPVFNNAYFTKDFTNFISTNYFGGRPFNTKTDWNSLDTRDENGLLPRTRRAEILSEALGKYADSLDENKISFEGSPFSNIADFRSRIEKARAALATPDNINDDTETLNALGLRASDWFNNGSGDLSSAINPETGEYLTYGQLNAYNKYLELQAALLPQQYIEPTETITKEPKKNTALSLPYVILSKPGNFSGKTPMELKDIYKDQDSLLKELMAYSLKPIGELTGEEYSRLYGAYKYLTGRFNPRDLERFKIKDKNLWNNLKKSKIFAKAAPNDLRMIPGINNLIFDTRTGKLYQIDTKENYDTYLDSKFDLFRYIQPKEAKEALERQKVKDRGLFAGIGAVFGLNDNERYKDPDGSINWTNVFKDTTVDYLRTQSAIADVGATAASLIPEYGTAASAILSTGGMFNELIADLIDDGLLPGEASRNLLNNSIFTLIGLLPFGKLAKYVPKLAKAAKIAFPAISTALSGTSAGILLSDENVRKSWDTLFTNPSLFTSEDFRNVILVLGAVAGISSGVKGTATGIKGTRSSGSSKTVKEITVENSKTGKIELVQLTKKQLSEMNLRGKVSGNDAAKDYLNKNVKRTAANADAEYSLPKDFKYSTNKFNNSILNPVRKWTSPTIEGVNTLTEPVRTPTEQIRFDKWRERSEKIKLGPLGKIFGELPTSFETYYGKTPISTNVAEQNSTPTVDTPTGGKTIIPEGSDLPKLGELNYPIPKSTPSEVRLVLNSFGNARAGIFGNAPLLEGSHILGKTKVYITDLSNPAGPFFKVLIGNKVKYVHSLAEAQKIVFDVVNKQKTLIAGGRLNNSENVKALGEALKDLKAKGWLKQGGRIDKQKIQKYKDFINK